MRPKELYTYKLKSHIFLQVIPILSKEPPSRETYTLFECRSDKTLSRKDIAKMLNCKSIPSHLTPPLQK